MDVELNWMSSIWRIRDRKKRWLEVILIFFFPALKWTGRTKDSHMGTQHGKSQIMWAVTKKSTAMSDEWERKQRRKGEKIIKGKAKRPSAVSCLLGSGFVGCCYCVNTWRNLRENQICYENLLHNNNINAYPDGKL